MSSPTSDTDPDLRDVFALLYADDDWTFTSDTEEPEGPPDEVHPPLNSIIPDIEIDVVDSSLSKDAKDDVQQISGKYTRKRFVDALDSLLSSPQPTNKKSRIYNAPPSTHTSSVILCTQPLPALPTPKEYLPYSPLGLLARMRTYQIHRYSPLLPNHLSPIKASLNGWINTGRNTLSCGVCQSTLRLDGLDEIRDDRVREEVARRLSIGFGSGHKRDCAWKVRRSPDELYDRLRNLLHPLISSNLSPLAQDLQTSIPTLSKIHITSPLSPTQEESLVQSVQSYQSHQSGMETTTSRGSVLLSLSGWYPYHPNALPSDHVFLHPTNTTSETDKAQEKGKEKEKEKGKTEIIHCRICQRRIGLWSFSTPPNGEEKKGLDPVKEHLNWCPLNHHQQTDGPKPWWEDSPLLREKVLVEGGINRDWVKLSDKLEKKPWRR
ncbi:hypothetical protein I302_106306 [Kwoniella bestiolae CBS 10118]|uniref:C3HC-type domain-containing protein n=1 Tax=Kwoniella bestiolae CBS 10118 TaxID=1296100 RepID=A0A1B9G3M2_9TREE|nr:hypothetical protein I302_05430 [Kwoniella bestiolae CBS 10118]OCF25610.1 hypothetical protein I302_05430 [Kwoniella bestiolae CBS 10118]